MTAKSQVRFLSPQLNSRVAVMFPALLAATLLTASAGAQDLPPKAIPGDLVTDYHGIKVADPYRSLEDLQSPVTQAWIAGQADYTRHQLDRIPGLAALRAGIDALDTQQSPVVGSVHVAPGGQWFYLKRLLGANIFKLYVRASADAPERVLLDPEVWQKRDGVTYAINNYTVSPNGKYVAAVISKADAELGDLQVFSVASGQKVGPAESGIWGEIPAVWTRDSRSIQFERGLTALEPGGMPFGKMSWYERKVDGTASRVLLGWQGAGGAQVREKDWIFVDPAGSSRHTVAILTEGIGSPGRVVVAPTGELERDPMHATWTPLFAEDAQVQDTGVSDGYVYTRTYKGASRYRILRYDLAHPAATPVEVVPQAAGVLDGFTVAKDGVYFILRTGSVSDLYFLPHGARPGSARQVALPFVGAVTLFDADTGAPGVVFSLEGWTHERMIFQARGTRAVATTLMPPSGSPVGKDWVAEELTCTSHDSVEVPMSVIYKRGLVKDGSHPTLMDGYGGYGVSEPAYFNRKLDVWLQRGGIYVDVKPRGGGAYGRDWYQAGVGPRKSNTWKDMIACGQALIARGYTSTPKLAVQGTSMGGVAVGRSITERPDLFAVGIVRVGITEALRFVEATTNGPNHESEMGSVTTAEGVQQLLAMSTYHQIKDGEKYPAVLFTAGMNDNRVAPWISFKTFARMSAATGSGKPVLLRVETAGGHGVSTTASQRNAEFADRLAFILWNTGDPEFQPVK